MHSDQQYINREKGRKKCVHFTKGSSENNYIRNFILSTFNIRTPLQIMEKQSKEDNDKKLCTYR